MATMISADSKYDRVKQGKESFSSEEAGNGIVSAEMCFLS
jgi:hypothetical protein